MYIDIYPFFLIRAQGLKRYATPVVIHFAIAIGFTLMTKGAEL